MVFQKTAEYILYNLLLSVYSTLLNYYAKYHTPFDCENPIIINAVGMTKQLYLIFSYYISLMQ